MKIYSACLIFFIIFFVACEKAQISSQLKNIDQGGLIVGRLLGIDWSQAKAIKSCKKAAKLAISFSKGKQSRLFLKITKLYKNLFFCAKRNKLKKLSKKYLKALSKIKRVSIAIKRKFISKTRLHWKRLKRKVLKLRKGKFLRKIIKEALRESKYLKKKESKQKRKGKVSVTVHKKRTKDLRRIVKKFHAQSKKTKCKQALKQSRQLRKKARKLNKKTSTKDKPIRNNNEINRLRKKASQIVNKNCKARSIAKKHARAELIRYFIKRILTTINNH